MSMSHVFHEPLLLLLLLHYSSLERSCTGLHIYWTPSISIYNSLLLGHGKPEILRFGRATENGGGLEMTLKMHPRDFYWLQILHI